MEEFSRQNVALSHGNVRRCLLLVVLRSRIGTCTHEQITQAEVAHASHDVQRSVASEIHGMQATRRGKLRELLGTSIRDHPDFSQLKRAALRLVRSLSLTAMKPGTSTHDPQGHGPGSEERPADSGASRPRRGSSPRSRSAKR